MASWREQPFLPWKGARYDEQPIRILLLGESHHAPADAIEGAPERFTIEIVEEYLSDDRKWRSPYFTNCMQIIGGHHHGVLSRGKFWDAIAFYNFVPGIGATGPRVQIPDDRFEAGIGPFLAQLESMRPDIVFVSGFRLYDRMRQLLGARMVPHCFAVENDQHEYAIFNGYPMLRTRHQSAASNIRYWTEVFDRFMAITGHDAQLPAWRAGLLRQNEPVPRRAEQPS